MNQYYPFVNLPLPYSYDALEPFIDSKTMALHHGRHLQTYIDNLNALLEQNPTLQQYSLEEMLYHANQLPENIRTPVINNAGGVFNHRFYFDGLSQPQSADPEGELINAIKKTFGSLSEFKEALKKSALSVFGSGYAWLVINQDGKLTILPTANQNSPISLSLCPILTVDVWEHAYYLKHYNKRADYYDDWFKVINWPMAEANYKMCTAVQMHNV